MVFTTNQTLSKQRQQAEIAFSKLQVIPAPLHRARQELESIVADRDANTARLREQRVARELFDKSQ